jgi:hypothetical protein
MIQVAEPFPNPRYDGHGIAYITSNRVHVFGVVNEQVLWVLHSFLVNNGINISYFEPTGSGACLIWERRVDGKKYRMLNGVNYWDSGMTLDACGILRLN